MDTPMHQLVDGALLRLISLYPEAAMALREHLICGARLNGVVFTNTEVTRLVALRIAYGLPADQQRAIRLPFGW